MEVARGADPDLHQDGDHLLPIAAFGIPADRQLVFEKLLEGVVDGRLVVSGKHQVGRSLQPFKPDPLAETDLPALVPTRQAGLGQATVHRSLLSIWTRGTISSSTLIPP